MQQNHTNKRTERNKLSHRDNFRENKFQRKINSHESQDVGTLGMTSQHQTSTTSTWLATKENSGNPSAPGISKKEPIFGNTI